MKEFGKILLKAAEQYPIAAFAMTGVVVSELAYNICVLIDRHDAYKRLYEMEKAKNEQGRYYY